MKPVILIPSYNSNDTLRDLITQLQIDRSLSIIIVDDGSESQFETDCSDVHVVRNSSNMGKGYSLLRGFKYAKELGFKHVVTMDADLQHSPAEVNLFLNSDLSNDFVLGYREKDRTMPILRKFSNSITSMILSLLTGVKIYDSQCGYRRCNLDLVLSKEYVEDGFQFESEVLIKCLMKDIKIKQIKIETIYDKNNKSYIKHVSDTLKFIRLIIRSIFRR